MNTSFTLFVVTALNSVLGNESVRSKDIGLTLVFQNPTSLMGCAIVMKSGNLNFLEPSGPLQACNGTALPFTFYFPNRYSRG
jgi:hypothetical protein